MTAEYGIVLGLFLALAYFVGRHTKGWGFEWTAHGKHGKD